MKPLPLTLEGVLFDLDGTLLDSAPDLYAALKRQCEEEGAPVPPYAPVREVVSRGARAVLRCAFGQLGEPAVEARVDRYLELYGAVMGQATRPFEGIEPMLDQLEAAGVRWGIVTNKAGFLTDELLRRIGWAGRASAVVSGDTLPVKKPDPAPVRLACERAGIDPIRSLFVGDDRRDVMAGAAAGLYTVAVAWGYLDGGDPHEWNADAVLDTPDQFARWLRRGQAVA
ncbi:phosphoglycolate phosphatase [Frateuria terrea]|uniref:phosphoglycolate phosphatase n=1 Tax=Frateuria terrea TaxID=529704 RepID=A0A1H6QSA3_9GAMM|nr:phosphoglycolate phosphatase [Frateuria terrea]SEI42135.1 phosphoglycolate phosphatase [Frateuria terrea]SFP07411.1 phosphoglycolate phosphatase [Frateuria terrea]